MSWASTDARCGVGLKMVRVLRENPVAALWENRSQKGEDEMDKIIRTSEFWMAVFSALGQGGVMFGLWKQEDWNNFLYPAIAYIIGRIMSKIVKAV